MPDLKILVGDTREQVATLPAKSVQCIVTSPPYWALRDYGTGSWDGGDPECDHRQGNWRQGAAAAVRANGVVEAVPNEFKTLCKKCGAVRKNDKQIGSEDTVEEFYATMVDVARGWWRVLRDDGCAFVNMGDCYADSTPKQAYGDQSEKWKDEGDHGTARRRLSGKLKPKDLVGQAWGLAFALRDAGWYLRSAIVWSKPNPLPESATDRPAVSHEYVFLLTKSPDYFYDHVAVRSKYAESSLGQDSYEGQSTKDYASSKAQNASDSKRSIAASIERNDGRNLRTVWTIPTQAFPGSHFATYPERLVEPCIRAGTSEAGACRKCGAPWVRVTKASGGTIGKGWHDHENDAAEGNVKGRTRDAAAAADRAGAVIGGDGSRAARDGSYQVKTLGWEPSCAHKNVKDPVPCVVLDPFGGSGTTASVARWLGRDAVLVELNPKYAAMAKKRAMARPKRLISGLSKEDAPLERAIKLARELSADPGRGGALARAILEHAGERERE